MKAGIIGSARDPQVVSVAQHLRDLEVEPVILDLSDFPAHPAISWENGAVRIPDMNLKEVRSWYLRSAPLPLPFFPVQTESSPDGGAEDVIVASRLAYAAGRERRSFLAAFLAQLERGSSQFVNPAGTLAQHFRKLDQLRCLADAGVPVPATLATNDPEAVLQFVEAAGTNDVVYKPLAGGGLCRRLQKQDLTAGRLALLAKAPVLFQHEIPGRNIRAYVLDGRVVAAYEIVADALDYRGSETSTAPVALPDDEDAASLSAARACGMVFTGIDIRRRPDKSFAVLECNPSPMFAFIERTGAGAPISAALAEVLARCPSTPCEFTG